jgi:hypothetical protein
MTTLAHPALADATHYVRDLDLIDPAEAARIVARVLALSAHWVARHPGVPFYTLGAASYLDADKGDDRLYRERAAVNNPLLAAHFGPFLEQFRQRVERALGAECFYDPRLALPGFHIYLADPQFAQRMGSIHIDLQFENIRWAELGYPEIAFERQLSLTAALELPQSGGGLKVWPVDGQSIRGASAEQRAALLAQRPRAVLHRYQVGRLAIHSGFLFHQIAPIAAVHPDDRRITLQAHALPIASRWLLYW